MRNRVYFHGEKKRNCEMRNQSNYLTTLSLSRFLYNLALQMVSDSGYHNLTPHLSTLSQDYYCKTIDYIGIELLQSFYPMSTITLFTLKGKKCQKIPPGTLNVFYILVIHTNNAKMIFVLIGVCQQGGAVINFSKIARNQNQTTLLL